MPENVRFQKSEKAKLLQRYTVNCWISLNFVVGVQMVEFNHDFCKRPKVASLHL